jgi:antirestriction protein ArdC
MATTTSSTPRVDIRTRITHQILQQLEAGVRPWFKPWNAEFLGGRVTRPLRHTGQPYQGINILMLWMSAEAQGFSNPYWLTYRQIKELGGHVKKGEHGSPVVYASTFKKTETTDDGQEIEAEIPFLKEYVVFNCQQAENLPAHFSALAEPPQETLQRIEHADRFFSHTGAKIEHGGNRAYYALEADRIQMPPFETFRDAESYVSVLGHETVHWTRASHRLNRDFGRKRWGAAGYALEELTAELGSAFLCADLQITPEVREDHASYVQEWIKVLQNDTSTLFTAASHASKAGDYLHGLQPQPQD